MTASRHPQIHTHEMHRGSAAKGNDPFDAERLPQNPLAGKGTNRFMSPEKKMPIYINSTHPFKVNCKNQPNHTEAVN